jgi:hypothetical protein
MRLDLPWRPLLALFGGTPGRSYVEVTPSTVRFRFGWVCDVTVPRADIIDARPVRWPWWRGIGGRIALPSGAVGLIGSLRGVVAVRLRRPCWVRLLFIPWRTRTICISLQDPDGFLNALAVSPRADEPTG